MAVWAISALFAVALAGALWLLARAWRRLRSLENEMARLAHDLEHANEELSAALAETGGSRILLEIVNPMTLARSRSRWGAALVGVAPRMIRRKVYETVARDIKKRLAEHGVEANLEIFHPTGS